MIKEGHFGPSEAFSLVTIMIVTKIFYSSPLVIISDLGTAAWYGTILSCSVSLIFFGLLYILMKRFPQKDLYQIFQAVTGKVIGKLLIMIFSFYFLYYAAINLREFTLILRVYSLPLTPPSLIVFAFLLVVIAMAYVGLEGIARTSYIFFYLIFGGLILILLLAIPAYDLSYLRPFLGYGLEKTIITGLLRSSAYNEIIILAIIINSIHGLRTFVRTGVAALLFSGLMISISLACILAAFEYTAASEHISGMFQLSRVIYYTRFFQRVEAIFLFFWVFSSIITVSMAFYISLSSYCRAFNIRNHRPLLFSFSALAFSLVYIPRNIAEVLEIHISFIRQYSFIIIYMVPLLVLFLSLIFGKKGGGHLSE